MNRVDILIAGGDQRQLYCAERLSADFAAAVLGFDDEYITEDITAVKADTDSGRRYGCAVLPVVPLDSSGNVNTPCSNTALSAAEVRGMLRPDALIFAGKADEQLRRVFFGMEICEYLNCGELVLRNAVPTAEGVVQIALEELPVTINGLKVLVVGMGRCGSVIAALFRNFGADVTAAVRSGSGAAKARIAGVRSVRMEDMGADYGLVINTVPSLVFDRERLSGFGRDTLFIDIASKPGGVDMEAARELGIKAVWALGIPGRTAPVTSGEIIAETVAEKLAERRSAK